MCGTHRNVFLLATLFLMTVSVTLQPALSHADETADIARILALNEAYAEASRARRAGDITRSEMQQRHRAIQAEARQIHASHGRTGSPERRAWDRKVQQAKNDRARQERQDAQTAKTEQAAEHRLVEQAEREAAVATAAEEEAARLERDARLTAQLRTQMLEDLIDGQVGWLAYGDRDPSIQERHRELVQSWSGSNRSALFHRRVFEQFIDLLQERSALTTAERRAPLEAPSESAAAMAAERDSAPWVAAQPRAADVIAAYPGNDPASAARRATALSLVAQSLPQVPNWSRQTLKATLLETEYQAAIFELDQLFPDNGTDRRAYEQARVATRQDSDFVRAVAEAFQPHEVARQDAAADWHRTRAESDAFGRRAAIGLSVLLSVATIFWAVLSMLQTRRGGFVANEVDGRLDVTYERNKHGLLAFLAAATVWGLIVFILGAFVLPEEEPQFLRNAVLRDPANAGLIAFGLYFLIFGVPAAGLLVLNLLRLGTGNFSITPAGIIVGNQTYLLAEEQAYFVEAPDTGPETVLTQQGSGVFFIGSGPAVAAAMTGAAVAQGMRAGQQAAHGIGRLLALAIARVRYSIGFNHQGGASLLAKGLSRRRANAILDRIADYLHAERVSPEKSPE